MGRARPLGGAGRPGPCWLVASIWGPRPPLLVPACLPGGTQHGLRSRRVGVKPCLPVAGGLSMDSAGTASGQTQAPSQVYRWALRPPQEGSKGDKTFQPRAAPQAPSVCPPKRVRGQPATSSVPWAPGLCKWRGRVPGEAISSVGGVGDSWAHAGSWEKGWRCVRSVTGEQLPPRPQIEVYIPLYLYLHTHSAR